MLYLFVNSFMYSFACIHRLYIYIYECLISFVTDAYMYVCMYVYIYMYIYIYFFFETSARERERD